LNELAIGDRIFNIQIHNNKPGQIVRSAGTFAMIMKKEEKFATVKLPSGEYRNVPLSHTAFFGDVSNEAHGKQIIGKAGKSR